MALQHRALLELTGVDAPLVRSCPGCGSDEHGPVSPGGSLAGRASMSLSHSDDLVVVSVVETPPGTAPVRVGVDVESCRTRREGIDELVSTPEERVADADEPDLGCALMMTRWTRKEAVLKAVGVGLMVPMTQVALSPAGQPPRVLAVGNHPDLAGLAPEAAHLTDLVHPLLGDAYHASVCVIGADFPVVLRRA
ncbi:4'-phosphopantetheinyl transferase family protein [Georgenia sp. Marseille-Q6866]